MTALGLGIPSLPLVTSFTRDQSQVAPASITSDYRVAQAPDPLDFHFNHVARFQRTNPGGTGGNDVTGQQRHDVGYPTHQKIRRVDQIVGSSLYSHFSVDAAFGVEVGGIDIGDDHRTEWCKGIE